MIKLVTRGPIKPWNGNKMKICHLEWMMQEQLNFPVIRKKATLKGKRIPTNKEVGNDDNQKSEVIEFLKQFDLNIKYGPCIGISRKCRMARAKGIYKEDKEYMEIVEKYLNSYIGDDVKESLWYRIDPKP